LKTNRQVIARIVGLFVNVIEDAIVDPNGTFELHVRQMGQYKLWILSNGVRLAERDVMITPSPDILKLDITIPAN